MTETQLHPRERTRLITLEWPLEFQGNYYSAIMLKRLTAGEMIAFQESLVGADETTRVVFPIYRDAEGGELPLGLMDALDADDSDALNKAALDFLPLRFRGAGATASGPETGAVTV